MTTPQLHLMRSLLKAGFEASLLTIFLDRCGASFPEWRELWDLGLIQEHQGRFGLTDLGRRTYRREKVGRWF